MSENSRVFATHSKDRLKAADKNSSTKNNKTAIKFQVAILLNNQIMHVTFDLNLCKINPLISKVHCPLNISIRSSKNFIWFLSSLFENASLIQTRD